MLGKRQASALLQTAIDELKEAGLEGQAYFAAMREQTMRSSAMGEVCQAPVGNASELTIRLRMGSRSADVSMRDATAGNIRRKIREGKEILSEVSPNPYLPRLHKQPRFLPEETLGLQRIPSGFWSDLEIKKEAFARMRRLGKRHHWPLAARFFSLGSELAVANTKGLLRYFAVHRAGLAVVGVGGRKLTSYAARFADCAANVDVEEALEELFSRASLLDSLPLVDPLPDSKPRRFDAVLDCYTVAAWMREMANLAFNGYFVDTGGSPLSGRRRGSKVTGKAFSVVDDWKAPGVLSAPFDFDGDTRRQVSLIEEGRYRGVVHDGMSARRAGVPSTGHSGFELGSGVPNAMVVRGGGATLAELVKMSQRRAIVVTYLHYPAVDYAPDCLVSGVTMHGTFLAKDGRCIGAVAVPMRIRLRSFEALSRITGLTKPLTLYDDENYDLTLSHSCSVPAMRIRGATFVDGRV